MTEDQRHWWRTFLGQRTGRDFLWRLISDAGVFRQIPSGDAIENAVSIGKRNIVLLYVEEARAAAPGSFAKMLEENEK